MRIKKTTTKIVSVILILAMVVVSMTNVAPKQVQAAVNQEKVIANYLNSAVKCLYLGDQGLNTYDFNIKKEVMEAGSTYSWYINTNKGNPTSITIDKKTGVVTAKEAGTAYIGCKVTLADGTVLRPEAKVIVRNNITEVKIKNLPVNSSISAGTTYDFNRTILGTDAGKGVKTQGITRWEIAYDTAGVDTATSQGIVFPTKEGKFKIRAVSFQSTAKYKLWLTNKKANKAYITAASDWATIKVVSSKGTAIATTQDQLNKALAADNIEQITLSTEKAVLFVIPAGDYKNKTLTVNIPNADVENHGIFKQITINAIKDHTWIEYADGNIVYLSDNVASFVIDKDVNVKKIFIDTEDSKLNIEVNGTVDQIIVLNRSEINITGSGKQVPVSVEQTAGGSIITTSTPLNLDIKAKTDLVLDKGAEETIIDKSESNVVVKIENKTVKDLEITTNNSNSEKISAGNTVISDGNNDSTGTGAGTINVPSLITVSAISPITGTAQVGSVLTAGTLTPVNATVSYQWKISTDGITFTDIVGATGSTYTLLASDATKFIKVVATGTGSYTGSVYSTATTAVVTADVTSDITTASVTGLVAPVTGVKPVTVGALTTEAAKYTKASFTITWLNADGSPATLTDGNFSPASTYKASITLTSSAGYKFQAGGLTPTTNVGTPAIGIVGGGDVSGNTLTIEVTFPMTAAALPTTPEGNFTLVSGAITLYNGSTGGSDPVIPTTIGGNTVTAIGNWSFYQIQPTRLTSVIIPSSVNSIGDYAFDDNNLTSVTIPNMVSSIGFSAFYSNELTSVTIPNSVTNIGAFAFGSNNLISVTIPDNIVIGDYAFDNNSQLVIITIGSNVTIGQNVTGNNDFSAAYQLPEGGAGTYVLDQGVWIKQ